MIRTANSTKSFSATIENECGSLGTAIGSRGLLYTRHLRSGCAGFDACDRPINGDCISSNTFRD